APHDDPVRIWAFVVAIDVYQHSQIKNLGGCVSDGDDFCDYLTNTLRVPGNQTVRLTNERATRTHIIDTFFSHLIHNPNIERGDAIIIYYAGHGDRRSAPSSWNTTDGRLNMVELICAHDEGMPDEGGQPIIGIPDRTFGGLMRRLAHEKGDNIVAIFDCCHSGGMHRSG
ncbi:uncharacterized protein B0H18DRAFT_848025, partial [Fomitopsis serialis]|uniref:uncharacterized protein n=1 Tax=Fomitopsis serialis TaxID=139415 RepID=UPI00200833A9